MFFLILHYLGHILFCIVTLLLVSFLSKENKAVLTDDRHANILTVKQKFTHFYRHMVQTINNIQPYCL